MTDDTSDSGKDNRLPDRIWIRSKTKLGFTFGVWMGEPNEEHDLGYVSESVLREAEKSEAQAVKRCMVLSRELAETKDALREAENQIEWLGRGSDD